MKPGQQGSACGFRVYGSGFRVWGLGFRAIRVDAKGLLLVLEAPVLAGSAATDA